MTDTDHQRWGEDVAAYLLGALESGEAAALERHAEGCERCQAELGWLAPAVRVLPESVPQVEPPPHLRAQLLAEVRADAADAAVRSAGASDASPPGILTRARGRLAGWAGAAAPRLRPAVGLALLALLVAGIAAYALSGGGPGAEGGGSLTVVSGHPPGVTAKVVMEGDSGTLRMAGVRQLPNDRILEAWVQRGGDVEAVPALFVPDRAGRASTQLPDMSGVEAVMVTAEPRGGSRQPTSTPIVSMSMPQ